MDPKIEIKEELPFADDVVSQNETMKRNSDVAIKTEIKSEVLSSQECFSNPLAMQFHCETVVCNNNWKIDAGTEDEEGNLVSDFDSQNDGEFLPVMKVEKYNNDNEIEVKAEPSCLETETSSVCDNIKDVDLPSVTSSRLCTEADFGDCSGKAPLPSTEISGRDTSFCNVMYHSEPESKDSDVTEIITVKDVHSEQSAKCSDGANLYFIQNNSSDKSERLQQCNISESFTDMSHLKINNLTGEGKKQHQCKTCDKSFTWVKNLKRHDMIHEGKKPHQCKTCDKSFYRKSHLNRHNLVHEGKKPHQCKTCDKYFTQFSHLKRHNLIHEGKKSYECKTCDKSFIRLSHLKIHNVIHEGVKPQQCKICDKSFTRLSHLKRHSLTHEGKKPHRCTTCDKSFTRLTSVKRHKLIHEGK